MPLSDSIEQFIKSLMSESESELELRRNELAAHFGCAPSQINYVLATRFSPQHGYVIESRRGGAGFVRIIRISAGGDRQPLITALLGQIDQRLAVSAARAMIGGLLERGIISREQARLMKAATADEAIVLPVGAKDILRAGVMRSMLVSLLYTGENGEEKP